MVAPNLVMIDTCVWATYFNRPTSRTNRLVSELIDRDLAAITGVVLTEILIGFKRESQADWVASSLRGLHWLDLSWAEWGAAAKIGRVLKSRGHTLPLADLAIAAVVRERGLMLASTDPHFDVIEGLNRFEIAE